MVQIADEHPDALPPGTTMGEFKIEQVLGVGGFGIVYRAVDQLLERRVALKEYLPSALAGRAADGSVSVRTSQHAETFGVGLNSFINEARLLARFDHPALVKVHRFWQGQGTAYMVMPLYEGRTLRDVRRGMPRSPDEAWLRELTAPLLGALEVLHADQVYHRDIAPDNVILREGAGPVLLDFGAARRVISDRTQTLTAILKPNFAPIEQYADSTQMRQGPWTDLYALAAVVYFCLAGRPPVPAASRALHDELPPFAEVAAGLAAQGGPTFRPGFLAAWQAALSVRPSDRPQSVAALRALLEASAAEPLPEPSAPAGLAADAPTLALGVDPAMAPTLHITRPADTFAPTMPVTLPPGAQLGGTPVPQPSSRPVFDPSQPPTMPAAAPAARAASPAPGDTTRFEPTFTQPPGATRAGAASTAAAAPADPLMAPLMPRPMPPVPAPAPAPAASGGRGPWLAVGAVVLVLAGAGAAWFLKPSAPAEEVAAAAASAPVAASAPASAAVEVAASAVVPVVVPGSSLPPDAAPASGVVPLSAARSLGAAEPKPAAAPARDAAKPKSTAKGPAPAEAPASQPAAPAPAAAPTAAPTAAPAAAPVTASAPAAAASPVERLPATATEACGKRVFVALWRCMEVQCKRPAFAGQADCASYVKDRTPGRRE